MCYCFFFFKQKTAYEMRISDWSSDVCSSDLSPASGMPPAPSPQRLSPRRRPLATSPFADPEPQLTADADARAGRGPGCAGRTGARKGVVYGKRESVRVDLGGPRIIKKQTKNTARQCSTSYNPSFTHPI